MRLRAGILALVLGAFAALSFAQTDDVSEKQQELDRIKKEIQNHREQSKQLGSREQQELKKLQSLDKELDLSKKYIRTLGEQENTMDRRIGDLKVAIGGREVFLTQQEQSLSRRFRDFYYEVPQYSL